MSSILVRGIHAPNRCSCCFLAGECVWACTSISRNCPISDFPDKHGRLIDADALAETVKQAIGTRGSEEWILDLIEEAETIVDAREVTDNG